MALKVPWAASLEYMDGIKSSKLLNSYLCLYTVNHTPADTDTTSTYMAIEATFGGYARIVLDTWTDPFLNAAKKAEINELVRTFTATGAGLPVTVYGIFVLTSGLNLLHAEADPNGGKVLSAAGHYYQYQSIFTDKSEF